MQEQLKLTQIPNVDTSRLSRVGEFTREVERFQTKWDIELEFNENARWRPGSYERLKEKVIHALFPHWEKPKGANTIKKLTKFHSYQANTFQTDMLAIDAKLKSFRDNKETLNAEIAQKEGKVLLEEYINNITQSVDDVEIDITSLPYFARTTSRRSLARSNNQIYEPSWDNPVHPSYDRNGKFLNFKELTNSRYEEKTRVYNLNTNPQRWFINIKVVLNDVNLQYKRRMDDKVVATYPYGDLVVCFTIPLQDAVLSYRKVKIARKGISENELERAINTTYFSNNTFTFPLINVLKHPFVNPPTSGMYTYQWGNTCFGDWRQQVSIALSTGNMSYLKSILRLWSETYYLDGTSPLNQVEKHHLGLPKEWNDEWITQRMQTNPRLCLDAVRQQSLEKSELLEDFCENCQLKERGCDSYKLLARDNFTIPVNLLTYLTEYIDVSGLPGRPDRLEFDEVKLQVLEIAKKLWSIFTISNQKMADIQRLFDLNEDSCSHSRHGWRSDLDYWTDRVSEEIMAPEEEMDIRRIARYFYKMYRLAERAYWHKSVILHNEGLWIDLKKSKYSDLSAAEAELPISDFRMMINTHRIQTNQEEYPEFYHLMEIKINQRGDNNGPF